MAKRFIDTSLFDDSWFMNLSKDGKLFWIYIITKCDHAGIIEINEMLTKVQTGIKSLQTVKEELGNRLIPLRDYYFFIPKYIDFQYPNFPNSNVKQQSGAIKRLVEFGLFNEDINQIDLTLNKDLKKTCITLSKDLKKSYDNGNVNDNEDGIKIKGEFQKYFDNNKFKQAWNDYLFMRKRIKKPATKRAEELALKEVKKLSNDKIGVAIQILEQSTMNSWQGIFKLKGTVMAELPKTPKERDYKNMKLN